MLTNSICSDFLSNVFLCQKTSSKVAAASTPPVHHTPSLNNLALSLFYKQQCIYSKSGLNGTQYKDVKRGMGVESARFHGIVNGESR